MMQFGWFFFLFLSPLFFVLPLIALYFVIKLAVKQALKEARDEQILS